VLVVKWKCAGSLVVREDYSYLGQVRLGWVRLPAQKAMRSGLLIDIHYMW
jgi:hypothetical protein